MPIKQAMKLDRRPSISRETPYTATNFKNYSFKDLAVHFDLPLVTAAVELGVSETYLKRLCRMMNIRRWPHRKIQALLNQRQKMEIRCQSVSEQYRKNWNVKIAAVDSRIAQLREFGEEKQKYKRLRVQKYKEFDSNFFSEQHTSDSDSVCSSPEFYKEKIVIPWKCNVITYWQDSVAPLGFKLDLNPTSVGYPYHCGEQYAGQ